MKVAGKVLAIKVEPNGDMLIKAQLNGRLPKVGDAITVKWGKIRSGSQNNFYWAYLTFLFSDCDLKAEYSTVDELHEMLKATFLSTRVFHEGMEFIKVGSTTKLGKLEFGEYINKIDQAMVEFHHCQTAQFFKDYQEIYGV